MNRRRMVSSSTATPESLNKGSAELEDYDVMEEIGSGKTSTVYLVNCKRGRLRNRQLALRKTPAHSPEATELPDSSFIHLSLSHPSIVSLFSAFSTPLAHFQLLELCSGGTLSSYSDGKPLSEGHLRGILKGLFEALIYLKNQGVVHRNIRPSNLLLTTDGRVKLCDFKLATHLPPSKLPADCFMDAPHFVAPEILRNLQYTCDADLWSVGCVAIACLSDRLPFKAKSNPETVNKILNASYVLPEGISLEVQDLVVNLLEKNSIRRMQPLDALSHPFFNVNLPVTPLGPNLLSEPSDSVLYKHALFESLSKKSVSPFPYSRRKPQRHSYAPNKTVIDDLRNTRQRTSLYCAISARRIVSDPLPIKQRHVTPEAGPSNSSPVSHASQQTAHPQNYQGQPGDNVAIESRIPNDLSAVSPPTIPVGTTRPLPFTTALMTPEMHKTVHGQITVLPSHSLLVDLREAERRRGQKGVEVLVINPEGTQVEVYSAPHLSLPCCLAEPTKRYTIEDLPCPYWRQYNDAAIFVERIKQRTPKLILHTGAAKCVLMANTPRGDIELLSGSPSPNGRKPGTAPSPSEGARMRIRLSRQTESLEIAKHISGTRGEEWTKKVFKTIEQYPHISAADWDKLEGTEQDSMTHLARFWRTCEVLEQLEREEKDRPATHSYGSAGASKSRSRTLPPENDSPNAPTRILPASFSSTQTLPLVNVALRPPKLPFIPASRKPDHGPSLNDIASIEGQHPSVIGKTGILPTWCRDDFELTTAEQRVSQTKYIPSVGWCIRQSSRVSQGGRYKIMFFDGATLEIDVDEDWAELTSPAGETTRCAHKTTITSLVLIFTPGIISENAAPNDTLPSG
ncbi:hypothetical protein B0H19DRAFT_401123 [Mycena capillaripes]|nr:hypothetical protein B0H19DRAFT_401123 [Mycena capillaripes]